MMSYELSFNYVPSDNTTMKHPLRRTLVLLVLYSTNEWPQALACG